MWDVSRYALLQVTLSLLGETALTSKARYNQLCWRFVMLKVEHRNYASVLGGFVKDYFVQMPGFGSEETGP